VKIGYIVQDNFIDILKVIENINDNKLFYKILLGKSVHLLNI